MDAVGKKDPASDVISHDVTPLTVNTDAGTYTRVGWIVVIVGFLGFLVWALLAPLDKGVPLSGTVATESNRKNIQHLGGGIVEDILVKDGDVVKAGQVLVRINPTIARAAVEATRAQYFSAMATETRLSAERDGRNQLVFPEEVLAAKNNVDAVGNIALQRQLFSSRQASLRNELLGIDENIAGLKSQLQGLQESRDSKKVQANIVKEQLEDMRQLAKDGYIARSRLQDMERTYAQLQGNISEDIGNIGRSQRQVSEFTLRRSQRTDDYQKEVRSQLSEVQKERAMLANRMVAQDFELAHTEVRAPVDGIVVATAIYTKGGVVAPGFRMMDIVPSADALVVEGQLPVNLIDKVQVGLPVEFIFSAFNANKTPHIPGIVTQVSADRSIDEHTGMPYYKVKARVSADGAKLIARNKLDIQSGMPVELFVKTGERTMMNYLMKPIFDRAKTALSED